MNGIGSKKEYVEKVSLIKFAKQNIPNINGDTTMRTVVRALKAAPSVDVAPRAEVASEIFSDIEQNSQLLFDGVQNIVVMTETDFEKLKKKYEEGQT